MEENILWLFNIVVYLKTNHWQMTSNQSQANREVKTMTVTPFSFP